MDTGYFPVEITIGIYCHLYAIKKTKTERYFHWKIIKGENIVYLAATVDR